MTEFDSRLVADMSVVTDGLEHIRQEYLGGQKNQAESFLVTCYINGVELWEAHRNRVNEQISEAGGIRNIETYPSSNVNYVECINGDIIALSAILKAPRHTLTMPEEAPNFDFIETTQSAYAQLSFGGNIAPKINAFSTTYDLFTAELLSADHIEAILTGDYSPTQIGVTEAVVTGIKGHEKTMASGHRYQMSAKSWEAKLPEEFVPDPHKDPEAYTAWRAEQPIPRLNITFNATAQPVRSDYVVWKPELPFHDSQETHFSHTDMTRLSLEGVQKIMRFGGLLNMLWRLEFGSDMPTPANDSIFTPEQKSLPPAH